MNFGVGHNNITMRYGVDASASLVIKGLNFEIERGSPTTILVATDRNVSMMFRSYTQFSHINVLGNVMYGLKMSGIEGGRAKRRAVETLGNVGLVGYDDRLPSELSRGQ